MDSTGPQSQAFIKILQSCDYDSDNIESLINPLFCFEKTAECLHWFSNNINEENVLTAEELEEYEEWAANNISENDDLFDGQCQQVDVDDIADTVEGLRHEIKTSNVKIKCLHEHKLKLRSRDENVSDRLCQLKKQADEAHQELLNAERDYDERAFDLDSSHSQLVDSFSNLGILLREIYSSTKEDPQLITQMSRDSFIKQFEISNQRITTLLRQFNLKLDNIEEENNEVLLLQQLFLARDTNIGATTVGLSKLVESLLLYTKQFIDIKLESLVGSGEVQVVLDTTNYVQTCLNYIQYSRSKCLFSLTQLKCQLQESTEQNAALEGVVQEYVIGDLLDTVQQLGVAQAKQVLVNKMKTVEHKQHYDIYRIKMVDEVIEVQIQLVDMLWLILTNEERKINDITCLVRKYCEPLCTDVLHNSEQKKMMQIISSDYSSMQHSKLNVHGTFRKIFNLVSFSLENTYAFLFNSLNELASRVNLNEEKLFDNLFQTSEKILCQSKKKINCLERFIMSGGTRKPILSSAEIFTQLGKVELDLANLRMILHKSAQNFSVFQQSIKKKHC